MSKNRIYVAEFPLKVEEKLSFQIYGDGIGEGGPIPQKIPLNFRSFKSQNQKDIFVKQYLEEKKHIKPYPAYFAFFTVNRDFFWTDDQTDRNQRSLHEEIDEEVCYIFNMVKRRGVKVKHFPFKDLRLFAGRSWGKKLSEEYKEKHSESFCVLLTVDTDNYIFFTKKIIIGSTLLRKK